MATITNDGASLAVAFPYSANAVADLKLAVPNAARRWDGARKCWLIDPKYGKDAAQVIERHFGERLAIPTTHRAAKELRLLEVRYLGRCKPGTGRDPVAGAWVGARASGSWAAAFPKSVLRRWFDGGFEAAGDAPETLFAVLGVPRGATGDQIMAGYRRMVKHTHPDVNREPDAAERFRAVQHAYEVLKDDRTRRKYVMGLELEASLTVREQRYDLYDVSQYGWRAPLRCGYILAEGAERVGRFVASEIISWQPITNLLGQELITSWPNGAQMFVEAWQ